MEGPCGSDRTTKMPVKLSSLHIPEKPPGLLDKYSWVYMICSSSRRTLYTGVTADLYSRLFQHRNGLIEGFTKKYKCHRLVYYESFAYISEAIAREKEIKGWRRGKKRRVSGNNESTVERSQRGLVSNNARFFQHARKNARSLHLTRPDGSGPG